jgi:2-keto-4-pentenoate hydratase/2-oxohepta-3-ene-1,7-dioic acid hydratase in catechol pathway
MKFISFTYENKNSFGVVKEDTVIDLTHYIDGVTDLREAIRKEKLNELSEMASFTETGISLEEVRYLPTITNPEKIICIGVNYLDRNAEYKDDSELPKYPSVFMRTRESLVGHKEDILDPPESSQLDYEGEIVLIVGKDGRRISMEQAKKHIAGMTIMNEGSIRDYLRHAKFNVTQGKNFAKSGSIGPWMVTADELNPFSSLEIKTKVNGELRQNDNTDNLMFSFEYLVSYLSTFYHLKAGDIIATGTPNGAGARFDPPKYLTAGDIVEVEVSGIGSLKNGVITEEVHS